MIRFADQLETVCIQTVEQGKMTKDLASLIGPQQPYLNTTDFLNAINEDLERALLASP